MTRETFGMTLLLFSLILLVIAVIGQYIFGEIGVAITAFLLGTFGYFVYPFLLFCIYESLVMISGKKFISLRWILRMAALAVSVFFLVHLATSARFFGGGYGEYLGGCWKAASERVADSTGGGVIFGVVVYPVYALLSEIGAYIFFSCLTAGSLFFFVRGTGVLRALFARSEKAERKQKRRKEPKPVSFEELPVREEGSRGAYVQNGAQGQMRERSASSAPSSRRRQGEVWEEPSTGYVPQSGEGYAPQGSRAGNPTGYVPQSGEGYAPRGSRMGEWSGYAPQDRKEEYPPRAGNGYGQTGYYGAEPSAPETPVAPRSGRDILFSSDPGNNYRSNLIYDKDSYFNTRTRRSSVEPNSSQAPAAADGFSSVYERGAERSESVRPQPSPSAPRSETGYLDRYGRQAEQERPAMPRRIVEQKPARDSGYSLRTEDINYPQIPSYKVPEQMAAPAEDPDFYDDVKAEETGLSSAPNIGDEEVMFPGENSAREETEKTELGGGKQESRSGLRRAAAQPEPEPVKSEPVSRTRRTELPQEPAADEEKTEPSSGEQFRSLFSRSASGSVRTPVEFPSEDDALLRRSFGGGEMSDRSEERPAFESRVPDALSGGRRSSANLFDEEEDREEDDLFSGGGEAEEAPKPARHIYKQYNPPSLDLLQQYDGVASVSQDEVDRNSAIIVETLAGFRVDAEVVKVTVGPSVTRYDIDIPRNMTVRMVTKHDEEIALRLHARDGVNMYSNSEIGAVSVEVPNAVRATVGLRSVMESEDYRNAKPGSLMFAIGKDIEGRNICGNIVKMTHILVAGTTNAGKSVCLNAMLISLICKYSPEDLRLILVDPKKTEFTVFEGLPHLMINEIISDAQKAISALNWAIKEMERRYDLFKQKTQSGYAVRNVDEYNLNLVGDEQKLCKIVIVVDELADLMSVAKKDIEERIQRLTQKARAAGIHLVLATQRPSVDVITGVIKGNLPTRIAFRVIQEVDSRTILDESGAEKLLGAGDMLFKTGGMFNCLRVQGAFLDSKELQTIVEDIKQNNECYFDPNVADYINREEQQSGGEGSEDYTDDGSVDPQYIRALGIAVKLGSASISLIQRKCSVGYNHAGKIMEWMELMGYVSPFDGKAKARTVLLTKEEYESKYGSLD